MVMVLLTLTHTVCLSALDAGDERSCAAVGNVFGAQIWFRLSAPTARTAHAASRPDDSNSS